MQCHAMSSRQILNFTEEISWRMYIMQLQYVHLFCIERHETGDSLCKAIKV